MIDEITSDFKNTGTFNTPGIAQAYVIDLDDIAVMPDIKSQLKSFGSALSIDEIELVPGGAIIPLSNDNQVSTEFKQDDKSNAQSPFYIYDLDLNIGNDNEALRGQIIRAYNNRQWILVVKEATGAWRLLGSKARGCDFKSTQDSGSQVKGQNLFKCSFSWESGYPAFYLKDPHFRSFLLEVTYGAYAIGLFRKTIKYTIFNFTGTDTGKIQMYANQQWTDLDIYSVSPNTPTTLNINGAMSPGTYYFRLLSDTGLASQAFILTV